MGDWTTFFSTNTVVVKKALGHPFKRQFNKVSFPSLLLPLTKVPCFGDGMVLPVASKANERLGYEHITNSNLAMSIRFNGVFRTDALSFSLAYNIVSWGTSQQGDGTFEQMLLSFSLAYNISFWDTK